ncbi:hypothetical protein [Photobacterium kishitanii]|uniref:Uncharacterized protein n=1 Tax=Photobacterium kishitanii TaxID=318456 RepID=A0A2T3KKR9_9GAMM|nr:hypothetical protein [Photobacterium kishitanii]PSV00315.1 hypothetical protein C9J27_04105 [Photobacterium kishitanii]
MEKDLNTDSPSLCDDELSTTCVKVAIMLASALTIAVFIVFAFINDRIDGYKDHNSHVLDTYMHSSQAAVNASKVLAAGGVDRLLCNTVYDRKNYIHASPALHCVASGRKVSPRFQVSTTVDKHKSEITAADYEEVWKTRGESWLEVSLVDMSLIDARLNFSEFSIPAPFSYIYKNKVGLLNLKTTEDLLAKTFKILNSKYSDEDGQAISSFQLPE